MNEYLVLLTHSLLWRVHCHVFARLWRVHHVTTSPCDEFTCNPLKAYWIVCLLTN